MSSRGSAWQHERTMTPSPASERAAPRSAFPRLGFGLGLRTQHFEDVLAGEPRVDWWEVITENFLVAGGNPRRVLREVCKKWPVMLHGVSLSIGSVDPVDDDYLARLAALAPRGDPPPRPGSPSWLGAGRRARRR